MEGKSPADKCGSGCGSGISHLRLVVFPLCRICFLPDSRLLSKPSPLFSELLERSRTSSIAGDSHYIDAISDRLTKLTGDSPKSATNLVAKSYVDALATMTCWIPFATATRGTKVVEVNLHRVAMHCRLVRGCLQSLVLSMQ